MKINDINEEKLAKIKSGKKKMIIAGSLIALAVVVAPIALSKKEEKNPLGTVIVYDEYETSSNTNEYETSSNTNDYETSNYTYEENTDNVEDDYQTTEPSLESSEPLVEENETYEETVVIQETILVDGVYRDAIIYDTNSYALPETFRGTLVEGIYIEKEEEREPGDSIEVYDVDFLENAVGTDNIFVVLYHGIYGYETRVVRELEVKGARYYNANMDLLIRNREYYQTSDDLNQFVNNHHDYKSDGNDVLMYVTIDEEIDNLFTAAVFGKGITGGLAEVINTYGEGEYINSEYVKFNEKEILAAVPFDTVKDLMGLTDIDRVGVNFDVVKDMINYVEANEILTKSYEKAKEKVYK